MLCLLGITVAGGSLLLSAAESTRLVDGAIPWHEQSMLRALVQVLCLNYDWPTINAGSVKIYILGLGSGLAVTALGIALLVGRQSEEEADDGTVIDVVDTIHEREKRHWNPLVAAKLLVLLFLLWSFASSRWSAAPALATGGSVLLVIHFLWSLSLGAGLTAPAAKLGSRILVVVAGVTAAVAIVYFYGRNPVIRAKFPFGNPQFLAACLIPGMLLSLALLIENIGPADTGSRRSRLIVLFALGGTTLALASWAFTLADTRGAMVGLVFGLLVMWFFAGHGRAKLIPVVLTLAVAAGGWLYFSSQAHAPSPTGRSTTLRFRTYSWSYAWRMFREHPLTGHGQGGYVLKADSYAVDDVLDDPEVFITRIAHAHSEWLEVLADLGAVGLALLLAALGFTFAAGHAALLTCETRGSRWCLIGLMSSLAALIAEECAGVGLRVSGVPTIYYTLIGLIWACSVRSVGGTAWRWTAHRRGRICTGATALLFGLATLAMSQQDWSAARHGFEAEAAFAKGDADSAIKYAALATTRLNPQRALTNLFRLSEAHLRAAQMDQRRAMDREQRALSATPIKTRLAALAHDDYTKSNENCQAAAGALKMLIERSPGYLNHGHIEYLINITEATNANGLLRLRAALTGTTPDETTLAQAQERHGQFLKSAAAAAERELRRQPFDTTIALNYVIAIQEHADLTRILNILARPLRHHRIGSEYVRFLETLSTRPNFDDALRPLVEKVVRAVSGSEKAMQELVIDEPWTPERLRLAATVWFLRGDYSKARSALELAVQTYGTADSTRSLSLASAWAELADCRFFDNPLQANEAIDAAQKSIAAAPPSQPGRELVDTVNRRLIPYLLAADNETAAVVLLKEEAPPGTSEDAVRSELGARYRRLCESLLARREGQLLRKPVDELFPKMLTWNQRALVLNPGDPLAHRLAADMAFHAGALDEAANHLEIAVSRGLPLEDAKQFLSIARQQRPHSKPLDALWSKWKLQEAPRDAPGSFRSSPDAS